MFSAGSRLLQLEKALERHVIGQSQAVKAVSRVIRRAGIGFKDNDGPIGRFLFASAGSIGVGRTLLAKSLAIEYFGDKDAMISLDMDKYNYENSVSKLIEVVRCWRPHSVVLLKNIDKAGKDVNKLLFQVLRHGKFTNVDNGLTVNLKNTIIIMTSNYYRHSDDYYDSDDYLVSGLNLNERCAVSTLRRELKWIDEVIIFKELGTSELRDIVEIMVKEFSETLRAQENVKIAVTERLKKKLVEKSLEHSTRYGAKSLKRTFNNVLVDNIFEGIENGRVKDGAVTVDIDPSGNIVFCY